jgi:hypothetical protein
MEKKGLIESLIMGPCQCPNLHSKLPNLLSTFTQILKKRKVDKLETKESLGVYSEENCFEFHQFLVTVLLRS